MVRDLICLIGFVLSETEKVTGAESLPFAPTVAAFIHTLTVFCFAMPLSMAGNKFERKVFSASQAWGLCQLKWPI